MGEDILKEVENLVFRNSYSILPNGDEKSNYGDLLRSTIITNCINNNYVWLTNKESIPLLSWFVDKSKIVTDISLRDLKISSKIYNLIMYLHIQRLIVGVGNSI